MYTDTPYNFTYQFVSRILIIYLSLCLSRQKGDFPKVTQAMYSGARQNTEKKLSRIFITQYPLTNVTRITNVRLHEEFKHSPSPSIHAWD